MKLNERENKNGAIAISILLTLDYERVTNRPDISNRTAVHREATMEIDPMYMDFTTSATGYATRILNFQRGANKLMSAAKRLAEDGIPVDVELIVQGYERTETGLNALFFNLWRCDDLNSIDTSDDGGIHFDADPKYTNETHDVWAPWKQDFMKSLEDAGI